MDYANHGYKPLVETWFLIAGLSSVAVLNAAIAWALTRDRARRAYQDTVLRLDGLEADIALVSGRLTRSQKQLASQSSVEARQEAKSLKDEATDLLRVQPTQKRGSGRPSVVSLPRSA